MAFGIPNAHLLGESPLTPPHTLFIMEVHMRNRNHIVVVHLNDKELTHLNQQTTFTDLCRESFIVMQSLGFPFVPNDLTAIMISLGNWLISETTSTSLPTLPTILLRFHPNRFNKYRTVWRKSGNWYWKMYKMVFP